MLDLLGLRKTVGTSDMWPPPRRTLESTFEARHRQVHLHYSVLSLSTPLLCRRYRGGVSKTVLNSSLVAVIQMRQLLSALKL